MSNSDPFKAMAAAIDHNAESRFGGAFVIIPPGEGALPLKALLLDSQEDPRTFFMVLEAEVKMRIEQIDQQERARMGGFGR